MAVHVAHFLLSPSSLKTSSYNETDLFLPLIMLHTITVCHCLNQSFQTSSNFYFEIFKLYIIINIFKLYKTLDPVTLSLFSSVFFFFFLWHFILKKSFKELFLKSSDIAEAKEKNKNKRKYISWEDNPFTAIRANLKGSPEFEDSCSFCHFRHSGGNCM